MVPTATHGRAFFCLPRGPREIDAVFRRMLEIRVKYFWLLSLRSARRTPITWQTTQRKSSRLPPRQENNRLGLSNRRTRRTSFRRTSIGRFARIPLFLGSLHRLLRPPHPRKNRRQQPLPSPLHRRHRPGLPRRSLLLHQSARLRRHQSPQPWPKQKRRNPRLLRRPGNPPRLPQRNSRLSLWLRLPARPRLLLPQQSPQLLPEPLRRHAPRRRPKNLLQSPSRSITSS